MSNAAHALTQQFLAWVGSPAQLCRRRGLAPQLPASLDLEDAIADGLVRFENGRGMQQSRLG